MLIPEPGVWLLGQPCSSRAPPSVSIFLQCMLRLRDSAPLPCTLSPHGRYLQLAPSPPPPLTSAFQSSDEGALGSQSSSLARVSYLQILQSPAWHTPSASPDFPFHSVMKGSLLQLRNWREVRCLTGVLVLAVLKPGLPTPVPKESVALAGRSDSLAEPLRHLGPAGTAHCLAGLCVLFC